LAALPEGDAQGRPIPLMKDLVKLADLEPILDRAGLCEAVGDFEAIYSALASEGSHPDQLRELEEAVFAYFDQLELPDRPTLYDHLVLSLREKDFVATFNWDPLLWQAIGRCRRVAPVPRAVALHGSVALGYCDCGKPVLFGERRWNCDRCHKPLTPLPLLYPVAEKDYVTNPLIAAAWNDLKMTLEDAYVLTIFGYGGPRTDVAAIELMKEGWGRPENRRFEEVEVIDLKPKEELEATWQPFIYSHHWGRYPTFYQSYLLSRWPRRTCEGLFNAVMQNDPDPDHPLPRDADWGDLEAFLAPLVKAEQAAA
jgi:hypothetical protein